MEHLITLDEDGRMVPTDRGELARVVAGLLDGPLDHPASLRRAGVGLLVLGRRQEAIDLLLRALAHADDELAVAVHINLGDAHRYSGEPDAAEPHYQRALALSEARVPRLLSFCLQHLGKQRLDQGRTAAARALLERALWLRRAGGNSSLVAATETALRLVDRAEAEAEAEAGARGG